MISSTAAYPCLSSTVAVIRRTNWLHATVTDMTCTNGPAPLDCPRVSQMSVCSAMHGNKLYTLQPNMHEQLVELQVMSLTLPEDIERLKSAKKRDQEQVGCKTVSCETSA